MVQSPGNQNQSKYAAVNEAERSGTVRYLNDGAGFIVKARKNKAQKKMWEACSGKYEIIQEGERQSGAVATSLTATTAIATPMNYWYVEFRCVK